MNNEKKQWAEALAELIRVAHNSGVPDAETRLWKVQHIDSSLSRLVRETEDSMSVIAVVHSPGALRDLSRMYPLYETVVYEKRAFSLRRDESGFSVHIGDTSCALADSDVLDLIQRTMSEFKTRQPRVM